MELQLGGDNRVETWFLKHHDKGQKDSSEVKNTH